MTSLAISLKVGMAWRPSWRLSQPRSGRSRGEEPPRLGGTVASVLEPDGGIGAETFVLPDAGDLVAQDPLLAAQSAHDEMEAVAVAMPPRLGRLHSSFRQSRHPQSHIWSHTWSGLSHTAADSGRQFLS